MRAVNVWHLELLVRKRWRIIPLPKPMRAVEITRIWVKHKKKKINNSKNAAAWGNFQRFCFTHFFITAKVCGDRILYLWLVLLWLRGGRVRLALLHPVYEFILDYAIKWQAHARLCRPPAISPGSHREEGKRQNAPGSPSLFAFSQQVVNK